MRVMGEELVLELCVRGYHVHEDIWEAAISEELQCEQETRNTTYIRYASLKLMPRFENPSVAGPEFRDKRKRGRPKRECGRSKRERGRYVSEAAPRFGNLCVYEPSALRKKPSDSLEKTFRFSEEAFRFVAESRRKRISERRSESRHQF